jgi:hypothetical protein
MGGRPTLLYVELEGNGEQRRASFLVEAASLLRIPSGCWRSNSNVPSLCTFEGLSWMLLGDRLLCSGRKLQG